MTPYSGLSVLQKAIVDFVRVKKESIGEATIFTRLVDRGNFQAIDVKDSLKFLEEDGWIADIEGTDLHDGPRWSLTLAARKGGD